MSNVYDKAHELAKAIENDENYLMVKEISRKVMADPEASKKLDEFRFQQYQIQRNQMQGLPVQPEEMEKTNQLYEELSQDPDIKKLLDGEQHLSILFGDINRILTGPLEKIYKKEE